jgi:sterol desaturase/sphingolipid hydroxylase (fatty acid hydroxylase superfamily)
MSREELIILLALAVVFTPLERLRPIRRAPADWTRLRTDLLHLLITGAIIRLGVSAVVAGLVFALGPLIPSGLGPAVRSQPAWLQFAEILLISEFLFYWTHRTYHAVPAMWPFHAVHHSSEKLDWMSGTRVHPLDQGVQAAILATPVALLGFSPGVFLVYAVIYRWHAVLTHANLRMNIGPLKWLLATPQYHHWHHADEPDAYDRNFGGQLLIFDWLFGTLNMPGDRMPQKYGLSEPIARDYIGQLAYPFLRGRDTARPNPAAPVESSLSGS